MINYVFLNTIVEGTPRPKEGGGFLQLVSIIGSLQKQDGTEIRKVTDQKEIDLPSDKTIDELKQIIDDDAKAHVEAMYNS